jgi:hypothetical protein
MYNFPNNPSVGQTTPDGNWIWDGDKWNPTATLPQQLAPRENILINGGFDVWQRGTSQTSSGYGSDDRWDNGNGVSTKTNSRQSFTVGQTDVPNNPEYYSRTVVTSVVGADNYVIKRQFIEGVTKSSGQTFTLSFYAKADASKNIAIEGQQFFGTGGSPSAPVYSIDVQTISLTTSWAKYTVNMTFPSVSGKTLGTNDNSSFAISFWFDAGSSYNSRTNSLGQQSGTFDIAQVKLEQGSTATDWVYEDYGTTLAKCQRYYYTSQRRISGYAVVGSVGVAANISMDMRTVPTGTITPTGTDVNVASDTIVIQTTSNSFINCNPSATGMLKADRIFTLDAEL